MPRVKTKKFAGYEDVYNMEVSVHKNYAINGGLIVHNCDSIRYFASGRPVAIQEQINERNDYDSFLNYGR